MVTALNAITEGYMDKKKEMDHEKYWQDIEDKDYDEIDLKEEFPEETYQIGLTSKKSQRLFEDYGFQSLRSSIGDFM